MKLTAAFQPQTVDVSVYPPTLGASTGIPVARESKDPCEYSDIAITTNPVLAVDYSTGEITATNDESKTVAPISKSGYANASDEASVSIRGNTATQLYTLDAGIYTPSKETQIIEAGKLLTGNQTILPIPANYYDMSDPMSWLGKEVECIDDAMYSTSSDLSATGFNSWTPSTTASTIVSAATAKTFEASMEEYEYYLVWECKCDMEYASDATNKAKFLFSRAYLVQEIMKRPSTFANIQSNTFDGNACASLYTSNFIRYYGTTTGSVTYSWGTSYGIYFGVSTATFSNSTSNTPTVTIKTPTLSARCSTTYFSTTNAGKVDKANSTWSIKGKLYRIKRNGILNNIYQKVSSMIE